MSNPSGITKRTRWLWRSATLAVVAAAAAAAFACSDRPTAPNPRAAPPQFEAFNSGWDLNQDNTPTTTTPFTLTITSSGGYAGLWTFPSPFKVGTGLLNPFLRVQASPTETGFNTDNGSPLDDKSGTQALPLNHVPTIKVGANFYRQFILDANENNNAAGDWRISVNTFDVYVCKQTATDHPDQYTLRSQFRSNTDCVKVYDLNNKTGFATDALTSGSGKTLDYNILIPEQAFLDAFSALSFEQTQCPYNGVTSAPCGLWIIVDTHLGGFGTDSNGHSWASDATFEEFSTIKQPFVAVTKTALPHFTRTYTWDIAKSVTPTTITLFGGQADTAAYTVVVTKDSTDGNWNVTGQVSINNTSGATDTITAVTDLLEPGDIPITLDCHVSFPYALATGNSLLCDYSHTFASNPGTTKYVNTVNVEQAAAVTSAKSDTFTFVTPDTLKNATVNVTDTNPSQNHSGLTGNQTYHYNLVFTCNADQGQHKNIARVIGDNSTVLDSDSATVTVNCLDVVVTKTANTSLQRTYHWDLTKTVTPSSWALFNGDDGTSAYTVSVVPAATPFTDDGFTVNGHIYIKNPNTLPVYIQSISDSISGGIVGTISTCQLNSAGGDISGSLPYTLPAGDSIDCTYSKSLADGTTRTNTGRTTAKPTSTGQSKNFSGTASINFAGAQQTTVNETVTAKDSYQGGVESTLGTTTYPNTGTFHPTSRTFTCGTDAGSHKNIATLYGDNAAVLDKDSATVAVTCYTLAVTKDAATTFTRLWSWTIDKSIDESCFLTLPSGGDSYDSSTHTATIQQGETLNVCYKALLTGTSRDSAWNVTGNTTNIKIHNNHPTKAATLTGVIDTISGTPVINATVNCPSLTVPAGGDLTCTYAADLPDGTSRTNTATATQQNYSYTSELTPSTSGTTKYSGQASVTFSSTPTSEIDECVDVNDVLKNAGVQVGSKTFGTWCASSGTTHTFSYSYTFGPNDIPVQCGPNRFDNTATFTTNDTQTSNFDAEYVNIQVECVQGCTLTQGYWKTHNELFKGGASKKADPAWYANVDLNGDGTPDLQLTGPGTTFFYSGQSWFDVFWTNPQGNAYYILADQYMAAVLNGVSVQTPPAAVAQALQDAYNLFNNPANTPTTIGALKGKNGNATRQQWIDLAGILGNYNEGLAGVPHCTENTGS